ncbi:BolA/IbaG family iron-sulfur metabolism protein [Marinomonas sp. THO17]|uniref:BolA family protein n=1 Tax=Marinomonas sp. THO17 TaxID=3149048 RepID=UPI00336BB0AE
MKIQQQIEGVLTEAFAVHHMTLLNESHMHNVPLDSESHFKLILVSDDFIGKRAVQRHQQIYSVLHEEMHLIHALALHPYTIEEWQKRNENAPLSPKCHGGE